MGWAIFILMLVTQGHILFSSILFKWLLELSPNCLIGSSVDMSTKKMGSAPEPEYQRTGHSTEKETSLYVKAQKGIQKNDHS
jgi:hypothetical protein